MHIKSVIIQGFRSYKSQTAVEEFSPKHNVVVGKNGSGKSNFFKAIQFVLGDESEFGRLGADTRQNLLHEGAGSRVHTAYVEVVFDNSDGRMPVESELVRLRRTIAAKQDQYTLNDKTYTKQDVANLLETAGFSKSNPYYIVKQGKVNELSTSPAEKRLALLYEVAGTKVYDERRKESQEAMKDCAEKSTDIRKTIANIEDRLKTLEEEKEDLKRYQHFDKKRRMLEHTVFTKDLEEVRSKVQQLEARHDQKDTDLKDLRKQLRSHGDDLQKMERELRTVKDEMNQHEEEKRQVTQELEEQQQRQTQLELAIKNAEADDEQSRTSKSGLQRELRQLENQIEQTELERDQLIPIFNAAVKEEEDFSKGLQTKKQRQKELYDKQNRGDRFKGSKEARDHWLGNEVRRVAVSIREKKNTLESTQKKLEQDTKRIKELEREVSELERSVETNSDLLKRDSQSLYEDRRKKEELVSEKNNLYREENTLNQSVQSKSDELSQRENQMKTIMGRAVSRGVDAVRRVVNDFAQDEDRRYISEGYRGMVIENIKCDENVFSAVDTVGRNRLFYHIVDTDEIATAILEEINDRGLQGEHNFYPLNRLQNKGDYDFPDLGQVEAMPLIQKIRFRMEVESVIRDIFGKVLVCRFLELATDMSKQFNLDCVTPDGDTVSRRGPMFGGYLDRKESRMQLQKYITEAREQRDKVKGQLAEIKAKLATLDSDLQKINNSLSTKETKLDRIKGTIEKNKLILNGKKEELRCLHNGIEPHEKTISALTTEISLLEQQKNSWEAERGTEMSSVLSTDEQQELNVLTQEIRENSKQLKMLVDRRIQLETQKNNLQSTLRDNLFRRRDEINSNIQESSTEDIAQMLLSFRRELDDVQRSVARLEGRRNALDEDLEKLIVERRNRTDKVEQGKSRERELSDKITAESKKLDDIYGKLMIYRKEKEECVHKIREMIALPVGVDNSEYMQKSLKELARDLDKVNDELKKFGHVNQRALDQYVTFSEQRQKLLARQDELDRGARSIMDLMQNLEQQKFEAIMLTFSQVTRNFEMVFKELVPQGRGNLTLLQGSQESSIEDTEASMEELDKFTGVGVKVTFTGGVGEMKDMHQLSGGQKTLVALATIFAIQKCDPAPFYLFDEIDQNLDPDHRKSVGKMIERLSNNAQFISTTFRAELLEHADKFYGVKYDPILKISRIDTISKAEAQNFVAEDDADMTEEKVNYSSSQYKSTETSGPSAEGTASFQEEVDAGAQASGSADLTQGNQSQFESMEVEDFHPGEPENDEENDTLE